MSTDSESGASKCPVDHNSRSVWQGLASNLPEGHPPVPQASSSHLDADPSSAQDAHTPAAPASLSTTRVISSIPRATPDSSAEASKEKWVYPSEAQFFAAMARKNHNPQAMDMRTVVPIHNAVNERAWMHILEWEAGRGGDKCGGVKLVTFQGKPGQPSPRARWKSLLGYAKETAISSHSKDLNHQLT
jgi:cytochrome c heme-lyase